MQKTKQNQHEEAQEDKTLFFVDQVTKKSTVKIVNVDTKKKYSCKVIQLPEEKKDDDIQISLKDNTQLVIKRPTLDKGTYYVLVENEDEVLFISDTFTITEKEKAIYQIKDINIMAGASFDALFYDKFLLEVLENNNFNASVDFKISYFPIDIKNAQLGFELNSFATRFVKKDDLFNFLMPMCFAQFNLAGRYKLGNKVGLNFKTGAGIAFVGKKTTYNVEDIDRQDVPLKMYSFLCTQAGCSVSFIPYKHLIMELGSDFTNVFIPKMNTGVLNTYVCIGVRF